MDILIFVMALKIVFSLVILSFKEKLFRGSFNVMISLFLKVRKFRDQYYVCCWMKEDGASCEAREERNYKRDNIFEAKHFDYFCVFFVLYNLHSKCLKHFYLWWKDECSKYDVVCLSERFLLFFPLCYRPLTKKLGSFTDIGQWSREWWKSWGFREQPNW
jgi:hypothetical protein